ncbi:MAG TPA: aminotransferase class I/II-fold pyridoxal phosphate-dependent enzyme [Steroidobacteraceae bacterium]|jgi:dTDP-4-amino-4,6-dideoxygalactose transaminase|nr:aminotransferase class I/II-fold pyridoxal phosphate-dependent enzyme [Steroidobacteraceae bacterium]
MYIIGQEEIDALAQVINSKGLFRYGIGHECERFEQRYAEWLGAKHFSLAASGSYALTAAMIGVGLGPGDEVLVPAHTYMASATSVLAVGAIPVIVDIDESVTISPAAIEAAIGPRTRAVIPVHMWGTVCDMDKIMEIARRRKLIVIEDACQGVGGSYKGRKLGTMGDIGAYSFNFYKNMSAGEGGGVVTNDEAVHRRVNCAIDPCHAFWTGRKEDAMPFAGNGARASEFMGAIMNVQLDRIDSIIAAMRRERDAINAGIKPALELGLKLAPLHSKEYDCATNVFLTLPTAQSADSFVRTFPSVIAGKTGRHTYTEWDQVLMGAGAAHPAMNPYNMPANAECRKAYSRDMCAKSLEILNRTVLVPTHPQHTQDQIADIIHNIITASRVALGGLKKEDADVRRTAELDSIKYDLKELAW